MKTSYRRRIKSDTWHSVPACSLWPKMAYTERDKKPTTGEACNQCRAKLRRCK